jgi:hypothetical protein
LDTELSELTATAALQRVTLITSAIASGNELRKLVANKILHSIHSANWDIAITVGLKKHHKSRYDYKRLLIKPAGGVDNYFVNWCVRRLVSK